MDATKAKKATNAMEKRNPAGDGPLRAATSGYFLRSRSTFNTSFGATPAACAATSAW